MKAIQIFTIMVLTALLISGCSDNGSISKGNSVGTDHNTTITDGVKKEQQDKKQTLDEEQKSSNNVAKKAQQELKVSQNQNQNSHRFSVPLIRVIDGDTIKVKINGKEESVRFLLVDTPETHHPRLGVQPFGPEASAFTKKLLFGSTVMLEKDVGERDKYGRLLMYVYTPDGRSVQEELLKNGLARVAYVYAPNTKYVDKYDKIQNEAQKRGIGIWSVENYAEKDGFHPEATGKKPLPKSLADKTKSPSTNGAFSPDASGNCAGQIKGNQGSSGWIYHTPEGRYYKITKAEQCFHSEQDAKTAGYRKSAY